MGVKLYGACRRPPSTRRFRSKFFVCLGARSKSLPAKARPARSLFESSRVSLKHLANKNKSQEQSNRATVECMAFSDEPSGKGGRGRGLGRGRGRRRANNFNARSVSLLCSSGDGPHLLGRDGISRELQRIYFLSRLLFFVVGRWPFLPQLTNSACWLCFCLLSSQLCHRAQPP